MGIKLSDYVAQFVASLKVKKVFVLQGGASAHLIDSIAKTDGLNYVVMQHEQAAAMAADSYSRMMNNIGVAIATSGPGATNLITGIACAYYDSIPALYITGNVASFRQSDAIGVRQYGFQETNIVEMVKPVTKYAIRLDHPENIDEVLKNAVKIAMSDRPGPVLVDIPDDFQRVEIEGDGTIPEKWSPTETPDLSLQCQKIYDHISESKRPVLVLGAGVILGKCVELAKELVMRWNIPVLHTWATKGLFDFDDPINFGSFGTNSNRSGNFIIQNADLILSIGSRLDTHATGKLETFAREAKIIINDIDLAELEKFDAFGRSIDVKVNCDSRRFIKKLIAQYSSNVVPKFDEWLQWCRTRKESFPPSLNLETSRVDPFIFLDYLSARTQSIKIITADTGANLAYVMCAYKETEKQRFLTAFNNTPMGYSLPAAIGASLSTDTPEKVLCFNGDGGIHMNIQELGTVAHLNLPIKIVVFNNFGHAMIKQTQDDWLDSEYEASSSDRGIPSLCFASIANAYGIQSVSVCSSDDFFLVDNLLADSKPCLIEVILDESLRVVPMLKYGKPLEDSNPLLDRDTLKQNMLIDIM